MSESKAPCWHCDKMFVPWTNEWFCSDQCHDNYPDDRWPKGKREFTAPEVDRDVHDDDRRQRHDAELHHQRQPDAREEKPPRSSDPAYKAGYESP